MSKTLKTDPNVRNRVYSGRFTGDETADNPAGSADEAGR
jgi:hypothetical protein